MPRQRWTFLMAPQDHHGLRWALLRYRAWLTPAGRTVLAAAGAGALLSTAGTTIAAYLVPSFALGLLLAAWAAGAVFRPRVEAHRELPPPVCAGETLRYRVVVRNASRRPIRSLALLEARVPFGLHVPDEQHGGVAELGALAPGASARGSLALRCVQRGVYELPSLQAGSDFPSTLVRWPRRVRCADRLIVLPRFVPQTEFELPASRRYQPGGIAVSSDVGDSAEFLGTREWREGDRLRDVHWASFARSGRLVVKEWREEYFVRIGLLLDTELPRRAPVQSLERRISLAAGIADALARRESILDVFAAGEELHHFQAGRALARLDNVLELLACVEEAERVDFEALARKLDPFAERLSSVVVLLGDWDAARAALCRRLREAGAAVRPLVVRDARPSATPDPDVMLVPLHGGPEVLR